MKTSTESSEMDMKPTTRKLTRNNQRAFYVETEFGCSIVWARTINVAENDTVREIGTDHFISIRRATSDDISWVEGMGGRV